MVLKIIISLFLLFIINQINGDGEFQIMDVKSENCIITEPINNFEFNLSDLRAELSNRIEISTNKNDHIEFNVCVEKSFMKPCANVTNVGACFLSNKKEYIIGRKPQLMLTNGRLSFNFTGDNCEGQRNYTFSILLLCDYAATNEKAVFLPYTNDKCNLQALWRTKLACSPYENVITDNYCSVHDEKTGHTFNLTPLSRYNQKVSDPTSKSLYLINICKPVLYGSNEMCPPNSSVCYVNVSETNLLKRFKNYGTTTHKLTYEGDKLNMYLNSDEKCTETENYTSKIHFECNKRLGYGQPEFLNKRNCEIEFSWQTKYACNEKTSCLVFNPATGFQYDFSAIAADSYNVTHGNNSYTFGICKTPKNDKCLEDTGACRTDNGQSTSLGKVNDNLLFNQTGGGPYLIYDAGSTCEKLGKTWKTIINFICPFKDIKLGAYVIEDTNCQLIIQFYTKLACDTEVDCSRAHNTSDDNSEVDITSLISSTENYVARINKTIIEEDPSIKYFINVCRPLVPQYGLHCSGSSACRTKLGSNKLPEEEQNLGYSDVSLTIVDTNYGSRAQLIYLFGDKCPKDLDTQLSSVIEFYCDYKAGKGTPILQEILHDCHYKFEWPTNVICPREQLKIKPETCEIHNDQVNVTLNLKKLFPTGLFDIRNIKTVDLNINICDTNNVIELDYAHEMIKMNVNSLGSKACEGKTQFAEIELVCGDVEPIIDFEPINRNPCTIRFTKVSPIVCSILGLATEDTGKPDVTTGDDTMPTNGRVSALGATFIVFALMGIIGSMFYVLKSPERRDQILTYCQRRFVPVQYSRVQSNEEASLLVANPVSLTDSDDELLI